MILNPNNKKLFQLMENKGNKSIIKRLSTMYKSKIVQKRGKLQQKRTMA